MAVFGVGLIVRGQLHIEATSTGATVTFSPTQETLRQLPKDTKVDPVILIEFDSLVGRVNIHPIQTIPQTGKFAQPKYDKIRIISIPLTDDELPESIEDVEQFLETLPRGFTKDWQFGLGLPKEYRLIVDAIEELAGCKEMRLTRSGPSKVDQDVITIPMSQFEEMRASIDLIHGRGQTATRNVKKASAYNWAAGFTGHELVEYKRSRNPMIQALAEAAAGGEQLTDEDRDGLLNVLQAQSKSLSVGRPEALTKLRNDIELVELDGLISRYEDMLSAGRKEKPWQKFLKENPFILSFAFGYPVILIQDEASVGGKKLSGSGEKVTDFLGKNPATNNVALFEIKRPATPLLLKTEYRSGVFGPSKDLAGSVTQALDQRYHLLRSFAAKKDASRIYDIESYAVQVCVLIGMTPTDPDEAKSFELFRSSLKDVEVITFDELLEKVKLLKTLLQGASSATEATEDPAVPADAGTK